MNVILKKPWGHYLTSAWALQCLDLYTVVCLVQAQLSGAWLCIIRNSDVQSLLWLKHGICWIGLSLCNLHINSNVLVKVNPTKMRKYFFSPFAVLLLDYPIYQLNLTIYRPGLIDLDCMQSKLHGVLQLVHLWLHAKFGSLVLWDWMEILFHVTGDFELNNYCTCQLNIVR